MIPVKNKPTPGPSNLVEQVARLIRAFDQEQMAQLLELVPQLHTIQLQKVSISSEQVELMAYYDHQLETLPEYPPMQDDDLFLGGLTVGEFFALPEAEQDRIWEEAHIEVERQLENQEQPVRPDALPAR
jgi:hypothetical protein